MRVDQRVERELDDEVGVELGEEGERIADAFGAVAAIAQRRDDRAGSSVGDQLAGEQERVALPVGRRVILGHWPTLPATGAKHRILAPAAYERHCGTTLERGGRWLRPGEGQAHHEREPSRPLAPVRLLDVLPEIVATIPSEDLELAGRTLMMPRMIARDVDLAETLTRAGKDGFDFLITGGVVFKETRLLNRAALELLGPGDVLGPPLTAIRQIESRAVSRYQAHGAVTLAELGTRFRQAARRWPGLSDVLLDRLARQTHRASMHLAMLHLPRIEDRVIALFSDLAERFGQMTPEGAIIDLDLTHELIGRLVGSRRSTVTLALQALAADGTLDRRGDGRWVLDPTAIAP